MYDLGAFRLDDNQRFATQALADTKDSGRLVTGMMKSAQRFVLELLTPKNDVAQSSIGCDFVPRLQQSSFSSEQDIFVAFAASYGLALNRVQVAESTSDPDAERIANVQVVNLALGDGTISINLRLISRAGTTENISVPLEFLV